MLVDSVVAGIQILRLFVVVVVVVVIIISRSLVLGLRPSRASRKNRSFAPRILFSHYLCNGDNGLALLATAFVKGDAVLKLSASESASECV